MGRRIPPEHSDAYQEWHHRIDIEVRRVDGFLASELRMPIDGIQEEWVHVLRFDSVEHLREWLDAPQRKALVDEGAERFGADVHQQVIEGRRSELPVTVALSHKVKPGSEEDFREWQVGIDRAAAQFDGFLGSERHEPSSGLETDYIAIFRFDSQEHLTAWRNSEERRRWMERRDELVAETRERRMTGGFDTWFSPAQSVTSGKVAPRWKQALVVLVALYPTSMLYSHFVFPHLPGWPDPIARLAAFVISILTLTWVVMPIVTNLFATWLDPVRGATARVSLAGAFVVVAVCGSLVALFSIWFR